MTARNAPPPDAPVCNYEEQMILRVPQHVAHELRMMIREAESNSKRGFDKRVAFALETTPSGAAEFAIGDKSYQATLVNLPCVVESLKTHDNVNYYKSADIGQMLMVHDTEKGGGKPKKRPHTDKNGTISSGVTPPFKGMRKRFRRPYANMEELAQVEVELMRIRGGGNHTNDNEDIEVIEAEEYEDEALQGFRDAARKREEAFRARQQLAHNKGNLASPSAIPLGPDTLPPLPPLPPLHMDVTTTTTTPTSIITTTIIPTPPPAAGKGGRKRKQRAPSKKSKSAADEDAALAAELEGALLDQGNGGEGPAMGKRAGVDDASLIPPPPPMSTVTSAGADEPYSPFSFSGPPTLTATSHLPPTVLFPEPTPASAPAKQQPPSPPPAATAATTATTPTPVPYKPSAAAATAPPSPFKAPAPVRPTTAPSPGAAPSPASYLSDPAYMELVGREGALNNEVKGLKGKLEVQKTQAQAASNPIVKGRFEKQVARLAEQLAAKEKQLSDVQAKLEAMRSSS